MRVKLPLLGGFAGLTHLEYSSPTLGSNPNLSEQVDHLLKALHPHRPSCTIWGFRLEAETYEFEKLRQHLIKRVQENPGKGLRVPSAFYDRRLESAEPVHKSAEVPAAETILGE